MENVEWLGHLGAFLTSVTFIPQVYKAWRSKSVGDLSLSMILIVVTSTIVWLTYAFALMLRPVIVANLVVCILSLLLLYFKLTFPKK
ncbi:MAG: SemiSWEET family transporter [Cyclobacteriaceae bacterium]